MEMRMQKSASLYRNLNITPNFPNQNNSQQEITITIIMITQRKLLRVI